MMNCIKIKDYFEIRKPNYIYLKLIPSNSIRNYNSDKIIGIVTTLYKSLDKRIRSVDKKQVFECIPKVSFYIYMESTKVEFYFIVPKSHYNLFKDKIIDAWSNKITITEVEDIPIFSVDASKYYLSYKNEDAMSLSCDKRNNLLLGSILNTVHIMEQGDRAGVLYNFTPTRQQGWRIVYDRTINKLKGDLPIAKNKVSTMYLIRMGIILLDTICEMLFEIVSFGRSKTVKTVKELSLQTDTIKKRDATIVNTQILCLSESHDKDREYNNAVSICQSFSCLDSDNSLMYRKYNRKSFDVFGTTYRGVAKMKMSIAESQSFVSLPGKELLDEYRAIEHTAILETEVPEKLQHGYISLGINTYHGNQTEAFYRDNWDQGNFPSVYIGEQGAGKTTAMSNYVKCILTRDEGCIVIDYIKNCELSESIKKVVPSNKLIELDLTDIKNIQGIGYNELQPKSNEIDDVMSTAYQKSLYIEDLMDTVNPDKDGLSTSMDRFFGAAAHILFIRKNTSLKDIMRCLNDFNYRRQCIETIPEYLLPQLEDDISSLKELDDYDKIGNIIGTKSAKVDGINHRINQLKKDYRLKMMFNKSCEYNLDLVNAMDDGKIILVKMPEEYFATPYSKNVIVTYLFTKIWAAALVRGGKYKEPKRFHVLVDEIFQAKTAMEMLREQDILPQTRKYGIRCVFSAQNTEQIKPIHRTLWSAGASYMLLKGSGKNAFEEFKTELQPYTQEDIDALPQYSCLCLINYDAPGRAKFITKLHKPL